MALKRAVCVRLASAFGLSLLIVFVIQREKKDNSSPYVLKLSGFERKALSQDPDPRETETPILNKDEASKVSTRCPRAPREADLRMVYMITPTYKRGEQLPELIRTGQTLLHVPNLKWIVVEDALKPTKAVEQYLLRSGLDYVLLTAQMPSKYSKSKNKPRGVANRNKGLEWVKNNAKSGVIYFGDDDNTYDIRIFEEIRSTKKVSVFPVGLVAKKGVSSPIVRDGKVVGFFDGWIAGRKFPLDMAGFAVSVELLLERKGVSMPFKVGYEEDYFLQRLGIKASEMEVKADGCTNIMVWHTQTKKNEPVSSSIFDSQLSDTNLPILQNQVWTT